MSRLHEACARAILPGLNGGRGPSGTPEEGADALAAVAIRVVLAEATQSIEALPTFHERVALVGDEWVLRSSVLVVLAALGEHGG